MQGQARQDNPLSKCMKSHPQSFVKQWTMFDGERSINESNTVNETRTKNKIKVILHSAGKNVDTNQISFNINQRHLRSSNIIQIHPILFNIIQHHPT